MMPHLATSKFSSRKVQKLAYKRLEILFNITFSQYSVYFSGANCFSLAEVPLVSVLASLCASLIILRLSSKARACSSIFSLNSLISSRRVSIVLLFSFKLFLCHMYWLART